MNRPIIEDSKDGAVLNVYVQPNTRITECVGIHGEALKIRVAAPPIDGAANDELVRFLARRCSIPPTSVHIRSGGGGRHKRILLKGITAGLAIARLNLGLREGSVKR